MTKQTTKGGRRTIEQLEDAAHDLAARGRELAIEAEQLEMQIRKQLARGTRDVVAEAHEARRTALLGPSRGLYSGREADEMSTAELHERIRQLITGRPMTYDALINELHVNENRIRGVTARLKAAGELWDLGDGRRAIYFIPTKAQLNGMKLGHLKLMRAVKRIK